MNHYEEIISQYICNTPLSCENARLIGSQTTAINLTFGLIIFIARARRLLI